MATKSIPNLGGTPEQQYDIIMRMQPHTYAEYVTKDPKTGKSDWVAARHLAYISKAIVRGIAKGGARIIVNMPPRCGKSFLISKWLPIWFLEFFPGQRVMVCSATSDLAEFWGRECRNEAETNPHIRFRLKEDSKSVSQWHTTLGGSMKCQGVGGNITGFGFDLGVIDDPISSYDEAVSPQLQDHLHNWYEYEFMRRKEPGASVVVLMHRFAVNDFCGWLMERSQEQWEVIKLPCLAEAGDPLGRKPGEALWPERFPADGKDIQEAKKSVSWLAMYQQNPPLENADRVYDHYTADKNLVRDTVLRKGPEEVLALTMDFNTNPGMHGEIGQYDAREDMFVVDTELHQKGWRTEHMMEAFIKWLVAQGHQPGKCPWKYIAIYGDRSGNSPTTVTTQTDYGLIKKMLNAAGVPFRMYVPFKNPPVNDRVLTMNMALSDLEGRVHMKVNQRCARLLHDLAHQPRDEDGQPDKEDRSMGHACFVAGTRILTRKGEMPIEEIAVGDEVLTRKGWRVVEASGLTGTKEEIREVYLSNGRVLRGTGNHPVWVNNKGWVPLHDLQVSDILESVCGYDRHIKECPCELKKSFTGTLNLDDTLTLSDYQTGGIFQIGLRGEGKSDCTDTCGSVRLDPSPKDGTFTIKTTIMPTIKSPPAPLRSGPRRCPRNSCAGRC